MRLSTVLGLAALGVFSWMLFVPVFADSGRPIHSIRKATCLSNVKQQGLSLIQYMSDHDERYPLRDSWMDATYPYLKNEAVWHCPELPKGSYGYALNAALSGARTPKDPERTPLAYESVNPIRNASDPFTSLPRRGRHAGRSMVAFADGRAKAVPSR